MTDPIRLDDYSLEQIAKLSRGPATTTGTASSFSAPSSFSWNPFVNGVTRATDGVSALATGSVTLKGAFDAVTGSMGVLGPVGDVAGRVVGKLGNTAITVNEGLNNIGNSGARLNNNLGLYAQSYTGARQSMEQYNDTIKNSSQSLRNLGANYDQSSLIYAGTAKRMHEDVDLVYQLQSIGYPIEEFNKLLVLSAQSSRTADWTRKSTQDLMIASGTKLANTFDENARLTGMSVDKQREALDAQLKKDEMDLYMMSLSEEEQAAARENIALAERYGKTVENATAIMSRGGPASEEETRVVAALHPDMQNAVRRLAEVQGTGPEADKRREAIRLEMDAIAQRQATDKDYLRQQSYLMRSGDEQGRAVAKATQEAAHIGNTLERGAARAKEEGVSQEQYYTNLRKQRAEQLKSASAPETITAESKVGMSINQLERLNKDMQAGAGVGLNAINKEAGDAAKGLNSVNTILRKFTAEQFASVPEKFVAEANKRLGIKSTSPAASAVEAAGIKPVERQDGSLGAVGKFMEDFGKGTPAILHGKEGVVTEKQFNNLFGAFNDIGKQNANIAPMDKKLGSVMSGLQSNLSFELEKNKTAMPKMADIQTMMASMTPATTASTSNMPEMPSFAGAEGAMTDMKDQLTQLNTLMSQLLSHTATMADNSDAQVRATKSLSGNMLA